MRLGEAYGGHEGKVAACLGVGTVLSVWKAAARAVSHYRRTGIPAIQAP